MSLIDQFDLTGRVAVVTGSGQGIGRAIAWGLADAGCDVVLNARRIVRPRDHGCRCRERGRQALIVAGDIRDLSEIVADQTMERFGRLDIWVNNVGGSDEKTTRTLVDTPDDDLPFAARTQPHLGVPGMQGGRQADGPGAARSSTSAPAPACAGRRSPVRTPRPRPG